jgi:vacuolar protein sorting-associated protein 13A/C
MNCTDESITFWEKGNVNGRVLKPNNKIYYTWMNPAGERKIVWKNMNKANIENDLRRDGVDEFHICATVEDASAEPSTSTDRRDSKRKSFQLETVYWVSFLDGTQRVLLFTKNLDLAESTQSSSRLDQVSEVFLILFYSILCLNFIELKATHFFESSLMCTNKKTNEQTLPRAFEIRSRKNCRFQKERKSRRENVKI